MVMADILQGCLSMANKKAATTKKEIIEESFAVTSYQDLWDFGSRNKRVSIDPISDLSTDLPIWRNRSQFLHESTALVHAATQNVATEMIGKGLFCSPQLFLGDIKKTKAATQAIRAIWEEWEDACHIDGQQDLPSVLRSIAAAILRDGDVLVYITQDTNGELKLDLISADRIQTPPTSRTPKLSKQTQIFLGVQVTKREIDGYWVKDSNGSEGFTFFPAFSQERQIVSVLLKNPNNSDRLNSYRGTPVISSCLGTIDQLDKLLKAEIQAGILKTNQYGILTTKTAPSQIMKGQPNALDSISAQKVAGTNILVIKSGDELEMNKGQDISNPNLPSIVKIYLQQIASVYNIPYNVIFNMMEDSSYSTNMTLRLEAWESTEVWRKYFVRNLLKPVYKMVLQAAIAKGQIPGIKEYKREFARVEFTGKNNQSIKPKDFIEANTMAIESNQRSIVDICNEEGQDAYQILYDNLKYAAEKKAMMLELGLTPEDIIGIEEGEGAKTEGAK